MDLRTIHQCVCLLVLTCVLLLARVETSHPGRQCDPVVVQRGFHTLNCTGKDRIDIPEELPADAEVLDFSQNRFTELPRIPESPHCPEEPDCAAFAPGQHCRQHISFSRNEINRFRERALHDLLCLRTLDLSFNEIKLEILDDWEFNDHLEGAHRLHTLILRGNPLGTLPDNVLVEPFMGELQRLDLSQCQLTEIGEDSVDDFDNLLHLNLSFNSLTTIKYRTFKGLTKLQILDLRHNQLTHLPKDVFGDLDNLQLLELSNNLIHSFHSDAFNKDANLQSLLLSNNQLASIPYNAIDKLPRLLQLDLTYNPIGEVTPGQTVSSVTTLHLDHLHLLTSLGKDALACFPSLVTLSISQNPRLKHIHQGMLADNSSALTYLYLEYNHLETLAEDAVPYKQLKNLELTGNPWLCDDSLAWMIAASSIKPNTARCVEPPRLKGIFIKSLDPRLLQHHIPIGPISGIIVLIISLVVVGVFCYLIWKRRRYCACTSVAIRGRYSSVYTRDRDNDDDSKVTFDHLPDMSRLKSVSNGGADDTTPFIQTEEVRQRTGHDDDDEEL